MAFAPGPLGCARLERCCRLRFRAAARQADAVGHAMDMGVDRSDGLAEGEGQHDIGAFSADAGQRHQPLAITRHPRIVLVDERPAEPLQVAGLHIVEAGGPDRRGDRLVIERQDTARRVGEREERVFGFGRIAVQALRREQAGHQRTKSDPIVFHRDLASARFERRPQALEQQVDFIRSEKLSGVSRGAGLCRGRFVLVFH